MQFQTMAVMASLLSGSAPLRGRASLEVVIRPLGYRNAASFWGITDPRLAVLVHSIVGGTPAYRREFVASDVPSSPDDFDSWVLRTVLNSQVPLFREALYLLAEETEIRDPALYHATLGAIAAGRNTRGGIADHIGRKSPDIGHPLSVLEDARLIAHEADPFRKGRSAYYMRKWLLAHPPGSSCTSRRPTHRGSIRWFAEIQRRCLDRGVFCSLEDLTTALQEWIKLWNDSARPFKWTKSPDQIIDSICRYCDRISRPAH